MDTLKNIVNEISLENTGLRIKDFCQVMDVRYPTNYLFVFFFFQAEDGIRDLTVTGVQTCALPICEDDRERARAALPRASRSPTAPSRTACRPGGLTRLSHDSRPLDTYLGLGSDRDRKSVV